MNIKGNELEEAKKNIKLGKELALKGIIPECREIANKFFNCIEENLKPYGKDGKLLTYKELEKDLNDRVIPFCLNKHNLNECLNKYGNYNNFNYSKFDDDDVKL